MRRNFNYAVAWLLTATIGTVAAIAFIPDDTQPPGALVASAGCLSVGLLLVPFVRSLSGRIEDVLRLEHLLMAGLVYWLLLDLLSSAYGLPFVGEAEVATSFIAITTFASGIWIGALGRDLGFKVLDRAAQLRISERALLASIASSFLLGMFFFAYTSGFNIDTALKGLEANRFAAPWSRGVSGGWEAFLEQTQYFGYVLPCLTVLLSSRRGWYRPSVLISLLLSAIFLVFVTQSGSRRFVGFAGGAALVCWLLLQDRIRLRTCIVIGGFAFGLLALMQFMLTYRSSGFEAWMEGEQVQTARFLHVDDNFLRLAQVTFLFPVHHPYAEFGPVFQAIVRPIPRVFWPGKPMDPGYSLAELVGKQNVSLTQSIVGELFASWGLIAVMLGGLVFGRMSSIFNRILRIGTGSARAMVFGLGTLATFASLRSMSEIFTYFYVLGAWILISVLLRFFVPRPRDPRHPSLPGRSALAMPPASLDLKRSGHSRWR